MEETQATREKIAQAVRILHGMGLLEVWGHISGRVDENSLWILGHVHMEGRLLSGVTPDDIVLVDMDGKTLQGKTRPPGEVYIHTEIYKRRPEVKSITHHHGVACITLSTTGQGILPIWVQATPFYQGTPIFDLPEQIDYPEVGGKVAEVLGDHQAALLKGHGAVVVGESVEESCVLSLAMERTARMQIEASSVGRPQPLPAEAIQDGMTRGLSREELVHSYWEYLTSRFPLFPPALD
jgi:L-fuculose-phosphate aldolase